MSLPSTTKAISAFKQGLPLYQARVEKALDRWLPAVDSHPAWLHKAMRYAVLQGGKRLRPALVYATGEALAIDPGQLDSAACAVELIHAYSLVHDDLPAMDDDDLRRGKPSCHIAFGEATAILAGDALQALAFDLLAADRLGTDPQTRLRMIEILAGAAGSRGMVGGQAIDLQASGQQLDIAQLEDMHIRKTGALIRASVGLAAHCAASLEEESLERLDHFAKCIGLAFQIQDDVLDIEGDSATTGKTAGSDARHHKATYPGLLGLMEAKRMAEQLVDDALESLIPFDDGAEVLRGIAAYVISRNH